VSTKEQQAYLKMIFQCFWPFRHPYPAFSWQLFPANDVFYPLASLFTEADDDAQDTLISIFAELPSLDDEEIARYLLPVALQWARDSDPERRRRIPNVLARINSASSCEALVHLQSDADPIVRKSAKSAAGFARRA
jgi:HEAT repeat protein